MSDTSQVLLNLLLNRQGSQINAEELLGNNELDPVARMLLSQVLSTNNSQEENENDLDDLDENAEDDTPFRRRRAIKRLRARFERMQQQIEEMQQIIEDLETHNDELAAALGACYLCWGEDVECPECHGEGRPGSVAPDWPLFQRWILPAVKTAQVLESQRLKHKEYPIQPKTKEEPHNAG
jgi:hypothetical protein